MAETQTENLQLELTDGDSNFDTDKVKRNFEKIDTAIAEQNKNFAELNEKVIYRSQAPFVLNQTVRISDMAKYDDNTMFVITAFRYAWGGSICLPKSEIVKGNFNSGFFISFQDPSLYWVFTINENFDLTLIKNTSTSERTPYVSITKL